MHDDNMVRLIIFTTLAIGISVIAESSNVINIDRHHDDSSSSNPRLLFSGIGAISGGGATSRLLISYPEPQRSEILDQLFLPQFAASLHILKVEIGGDSQSTDGTETSHMHSATDLDCSRGYEWWLLKEAKKRNMNILTYGLPWSFPGWVEGPNATHAIRGGNPFKRPDLTSDYVTKWLECARDVHGIVLDYIGVWNESTQKGIEAYAKLLRTTLDARGFQSTKIIARDDGSPDICDDLNNDADYKAAVHAIGLHYPSDYPVGRLDKCHATGLPVWAAEESSSYADKNGAACWARVLASHYVLSGITTSIMWNLVGSYAHGTNWYASSLFTANQPWSGHYDRDDAAPVVWATAHYTQFTQPGWNYLPVGAGSGELSKGGFYNSLTSPDGKDFTLILVKISRDHASCTRPPLPDFDVGKERMTFNLPVAEDKPLYVWKSNFELNGGKLFEYIGMADISREGLFSLDVEVGDVITISTVDTASKGSFDTKLPGSNTMFPLPYADDFDDYNIGQEADYFADQIGAWEIQPEEELGVKSNLVMKQMVPSLPIGGIGSGCNARGPMTVIGMVEFNDLDVTAKFRLPIESKTDLVAACLEARVSQCFRDGIVLCVSALGRFTLSYGGPLNGGNYDKSNIIKTGQAPVSVGLGAWHELHLIVSGTKAYGSLDGRPLFIQTTIRDTNTGFGAIGANMFESVEFDDFMMSLASSSLPSTATARTVQDLQHFSSGQTLGTSPCSRNGEIDPTQNFLLKYNWQIYHVASGLCAEAGSTSGISSVKLAPCNAGATAQQFRHDYSHIRIWEAPITLGSYGTVQPTLTLVGFLNGTTSMSPEGEKLVDVADKDVMWNKWTLFPNTGQLRNTHVENLTLGYPSCLTVKDDSSAPKLKAKK